MKIYKTIIMEEQSPFSVSAHGDTNPTTTWNSVPIPWPDATQNQIAIVHCWLRLSVQQNSDPLVYRVRMSFNRLSDGRPIGENVLDIGTPGWGGLDANNGITGEALRDVTFSTYQNSYILAAKATGLQLQWKAISSNYTSSNASNLPFVAQFGGIITYGLVDANGNPIPDGASGAAIVQTIFFTVGSGSTVTGYVLKSDGTLWTGTIPASGTITWAQRNTP